MSKVCWAETNQSRNKVKGRKPMTRFFIWPILVVAGIILTAASGLLLTEAFYSPGGEIDSFYGLPLPWKQDRELVCSPLHPQACQSPIYLTQFDWLVFAVDVLFYTGIGYGLVRILTKNREKSPTGAPSQP